MTHIRSKAPSLTRRGFLSGAAGLSFVLTVGPKGIALISPAQAMAERIPIGAWVRITTDNRVIILTPGAEMGQGSMTGVPVVLAEELDADWDKVVLEWAPADAAIYGYEVRGRRSMVIAGSRAVQSYYDDMRIAGAQVRKVLLLAAAKKWKVSADALTTGPNVVLHAASGRRMTYGEIATFAEAPAKMPAVGRHELKKPGDFRLIGKPVDRRDVPPKVDGSAQFSIDVQLPGMVFASTVHGPVQLSKPLRWNDAEVRAMKGVIDVIKLDEGVAVVADTYTRVMAARNALNVQWSQDALATGYDSEAALSKTYGGMLQDEAAATKVRQSGDTDAAFRDAAKRFKGRFKTDYVYHAQMEPLNGVARFNEAGDRLEVWEGTQAPDSSRHRIARALGLDPSQVIHHQHYMGGAFGRRTLTDYTIEAAQIARAVKKPVKMIWTREEDMGYGMFRPQTLQSVEAAMDKDGKVSGWRHIVVGDGGRLVYSGIKLDLYYRIANQDIAYRGIEHGIRLKSWRAVAHPINLFAIEAMVDEMAAAEGLDPFAFRRQRLGMTRKAARLFDMVETMSDWKTKRPGGRALGVSVSERSGSLAAGVVEASLDRKSGKIRVHKVWIAIDSGTVVQPEMARRNVESGVIYGLSSVLMERATVKGGAVEQSNFGDYRVLRMADAPEEIHVAFAESTAKPKGIGEIGNPFISAAVANAFFALTGKRLYHMPFTPERVLAALKA